ncbi:MAG: hypothetical protein R2699_18810 [Acidimicrobiales bacterium]
MPLSRSAGRAIRAPSAAATAAPTTIATSTDIPVLSTSWAVAKAPTAAKAAWHSEICPARPTTTVTDKKIRLRMIPG